MGFLDRLRQLMNPPGGERDPIMGEPLPDEQTALLSPHEQDRQLDDEHVPPPPAEH